MIHLVKKKNLDHVIVQKHIVYSYIVHVFIIEEHVQMNVNVMIAIMMVNMKMKY